MSKRVAAVFIEGKIKALPNGDVLVSNTGSSATSCVQVIEVGEAVTAGNLVTLYSSGGGLKVKPADSDSTGTETHGFVTETVSAGNDVPVIFAGLNESLSGLTAGTRYYLGNSGTVTATKPTGTGKVVQFVGQAVSSSVLVFNPDAGEVLP